MVNLLNRYVSTDMDQWELWKFDTDRCAVYIEITMEKEPSTSEEAYLDLTHLISREEK